MKYWETLLKETQEKPAAQNTFCSKEEVITKTKKKQTYLLGEDYPDIYLTQREAECMSLFLESKTVVQTASQLNLSPRTVEFYLKNIKLKLDCKTKTDVVHLVKETDFLKNYTLKPKSENHN